MQLKGITEEDLIGILFVNFPNDLPLDVCRERLEFLIFEEYERECKDLADDERPDFCISPYWVYRGLYSKALHEISMMDEDEIAKEKSWCMDERQRRIAGRKKVGKSSLSPS